MPLINLIQEQQLSSRREDARSRLFFMSFVASAAAAAAAFGFLLFQTDAAKGELAEMEAKNQQMAPLLKQIEENSRLAGQLSPRLNTLESAQLLTNRWSKILDHLVVNTPGQTWLTGVRCFAQDPSKPVNVSFVGMAANQELVGEMILRLQGCTELQTVNLKYTAEKIVTEGNGIEFEITADLAGSAAEKPKDEQEASK